VALSRFVLQLAEVSPTLENVRLDFIIADDTELSKQLARLAVPATRVTTFDRRSPHQLLSNFPAARAAILGEIARTKPGAVVTLMPHVWSPLIAPAIKRGGTRYATIVHDAKPHPGDPTALVTAWLLRDARHADVVVTLSQAVADQIANRGRIRKARVVRLFHPDLASVDERHSRTLDPRQPFRLLFFGRIMAYKGLPLLIEAVEMLRTEGFDVSLGVAGQGDLASSRGKLEALGAEVINRWLTDEEASDLLARYDAMACSHVEASQSGVAALAFGHGLPVVALPVGGVAEQVAHGQTGVLAADISARGFADAVRQLITEGGLYDRICCHLATTQGDRSMLRFATELVSSVLPSNASCGNECASNAD